MQYVKKMVFFYCIVGNALYGAIDLQKPLTDLQQKYETIHSSLRVLNNAIQDFPAKEQSNVLSQIQATQAQIEKTYTTAVTQIKAGISQVEGKSLIIQDIELSQLNNVAHAAQVSMEIDLTHINATVQAMAEQLHLTQALQNAQQIEQQQAQYHQRVIMFIQALQPVIQSFSQLQDTIARALVNQVQTKSVNLASIAAISDAAQALLKQAYQVYGTNKFPIVVDDSVNYVRASFNQLAHYFTNEMALSIQASNALLVNPSTVQKAFSLLAELGVRILGIKNSAIAQSIQQLPAAMLPSQHTLFLEGYTATIKSLATTYFAQEAAVVVEDYQNTKEKVTFSAYVNALQQLVTNTKEPSAQDIAYATIYYAVILDDFTVLAPEFTTRWKQQIAQTMGAFYATRATVLLKSMKPGADTSQSLQEVLYAYRQAVYYYSVAGGTQNSTLAQTYTGIAANLMQANNAFGKAQIEARSNNYAAAIALYQQAVDGFKQLGDAVNASQAQFQLQVLEATQNSALGKNTLQNYLRSSQATFIQYMSFISQAQGQTVESFDTYAVLYTNLQEACQSALQAYKNAQSFLVALAAQQQPQQQSTQSLSDQMLSLSTAISWLQDLLSGIASLQAGDNQLRSISNGSTSTALVGAINQAEVYYAAAVQLFKNADELYQSNTQILDYTLVQPDSIAQKNRSLQKFLSKGQQWTWTTVVSRHSAAFYMAAAAQIKNSMFTMQCYSNALVQNQFLSNGMLTFLKTNFQSLATQKAEVDSLFKQAQNHEKQALAAPMQAWQPSSGAKIYESNANSLWRSTLRMYATAYNLGNTQAKDAFFNAVQEYATAYQKAEIPEQFYPDLGLALIYYAAYALYMSENALDKSKEILNQIVPHIKNFFNQGIALQQTFTTALENSSTNLQQLQAALVSLNQFKVWLQYAHYAVLEQGVVVQRTVPTINQGITQLITQTSLSGVIKFASLFIPPTALTISTLHNTEAELYVRIGTQAFQDNNYKTAYASYKEAKKIYESTNQASLAVALEQQYNLARTLATAEQFRELILPNSKEAHGIAKQSVGGVLIPQEYMLKVYEQNYPLPVAAGFDSLTQASTQQQQQQLQSQLIGMIGLLYVYNILQYQGISFNDVIDSNTMTPKPSLPQAYVQIVQNALTQAQLYQKDLQNRIKNKISSVYVQKKDQIYSIGEVYKPISSIPPTDAYGNSLLPYTTYPYALYYYAAAYNLYKPGSDDVTIGTNIYVPGNDLASAKEMLALIANAYLQEAARQKEAMSLPGSLVIQALNSVKGSNPQDPTLVLSEYMSDYLFVKNYYNNLLLVYYYTAYYYYAQYLQNKNYAAGLATLLGDTYTELAQNLSLFLLGNPLSSEYSMTVLPDIEKFYKTAAAYYNNQTALVTLYTKIAELYTNAGQIVVANGNFIYALGFLYRAEQLYKDIQQQNANTAQLLEKAVLLKLETMFKGATQKLQHYINKRFAGFVYPGTEQKRPLIGLTLSTGQKVQETFAALRQKYQTAGMTGLDQQGIDSVELQEYSAIKSDILDSLIFYSACSSAAAQQVPQSTLAKNAKTLSPGEQTGLDLIASYTKEKNISLSSVSATMTLLQQDNFADLVNNAFDTWRQLIQQATTTQDKQKGYVAIMQWANMLYLAFAQVYMQDYLGGEVSVQQWQDFTQALQAQIEEIQAPSSLYS